MQKSVPTIRQPSFGIPRALILRAEKRNRCFRIRKRRIDKFITIDAKTSVDLDDGFYVKKLKSGAYILKVYITDLTEIIQKGGYLDNYAREKYFTNYMPRNIDHMFPVEIVKCASLLPNRVRRVWSLETRIENGRIINYKIRRKTAKSIGRYEPGKIYSLLKRPNNNLFKDLYDVACDLRYIRIGKSISNKRTMGHSIVEEIMILTNHLKAKFISKHGVPMLYRIAPKPKKDLMNTIKEAFRTDDVYDWLALYHGFGTYSIKRKKHFGVYKNPYSHSSSPIRRYADITTQRQLAYICENQDPMSKEELSSLSRIINIQERVINSRKTVYFEKPVCQTTGLILDINKEGIRVYSPVFNITGLLLEKTKNKTGDHVFLSFDGYNVKDSIPYFNVRKNPLPRVPFVNKHSIEMIE